MYLEFRKLICQLDNQIIKVIEANRLIKILKIISKKVNGGKNAKKC
jgi:hypothetical protein